MIVAEEEAKTKLCFKASAFGASQQLVDGPGPLCVGNACMAWRTAYATPEQRRQHVATMMKLGKTEDQAISALNYMEEETRPGFCGLAGKP